MSATSHMPLGWPLPKRRAELKKLQTMPAEHKLKLTFQNQPQLFDVYRVQIDLPKYRLANGRTEAAQQEYLGLHSQLPEDFFSADTESEEAQAVQHDILSKMLGSDPATNLLKYFSTHKQDEPLILCSEGYVVNGNRRLCAMRTLYYKADGTPNKEHLHFSHIDAVILPPCDDKDIDELEARLQVQPDIKDEYTWVAKAMMMRKRQEKHNYGNEELARIYDMQAKDVRDLLDWLACAEEYLSDRGKQKQYHLVENNRYAFEQLQRERRKVKRPDAKDLLTQVTYVFVDGPDNDSGIEISGRLYSLVPKMRQYLPAIVTSLSEEISTQSTAEKPSPDGDLLGEGEDDLGPLAAAVANPDNRNVVIEVVQDVIAGEESRTRQRKKANSVLQEVKKANQALSNAINFIGSESNTSGVSEQLRAIEISLAKLQEWLRKHASD